MPYITKYLKGAEKLIASLEPFRNDRFEEPDKTLLLESLEFLLSFISFHGPNCPVLQKGPGYEVYHGTAIELAGTGRANPGSMIAALAAAEQIAQRALAAL